MEILALSAGRPWRVLNLTLAGVDPELDLSGSSVDYLSGGGPFSFLELMRIIAHHIEWWGTGRGHADVRTLFPKASLRSEGLLTPPLPPHPLV